MKNIMLSAITSLFKNLSPVLSFLRQRESVKAPMSRVLILLLLAQPMLVNAAPFVHGAEATAQRGVAKLRSWMPKTVEAKAAEAPKPVMEKAIGIDEWMAQSESKSNPTTNRTTNSSANSETLMPIPDLKNFTSPFKIFPTMAMFQSGTSLEMGATGPAGTGPSTAAQAVTLFENAVTAYAPTTTVTYTLSNQQFGPGTVQGVATNSAINFGGSGNSTADSPVGGFNLYSLMNGISGSTNAMYTACVTCAAGTSIDVATDRAISFNVITDAFINAANTNLQALNARVYVGDVTISFNRPVSNPVLQFTGMGGQGSFTNSVTVGAVTTTKSYDLGYAAEFDLVGSGVTLSKLNGNSVLNVTSNSITNTATRIGASSVGAVINGITRTAASGSVLATGTNITSITMKMYIRGDGGVIQSTTQFPVTASATWIPATADAPYEPKWAIAAGYLNTPTTTNAGSIAGDTFLIGASIQKPVTISGTVFNDTNGLSDSIINGTGTNAGGVNAILVDAAGDVIASVAVPSTGIYSFTGIGEGNYTVRLSTTAGVQDTPAPAISLPATWSNQGEGAAAAGDGTVDGNTAITVAPGVDRTGVNFGIAQPGLSLAKTNPVSFAVGTAANYTLTVSNAANRPTSGTSVVVNEKLPPNIAYNSAAASTGATGASCTSSGTLAAGLDLICTITTAAGITGGGSAAFTLNVTPQAAASGVAGINKAAVDPAGGTPVAPGTCTGTNTPAGCALAPSITPTTAPAVAGYKSVKLTTDADSSSSITPGDTLIWTMQYANTGSGNATNFQINDALPSGLTITATGGQTVTVSGSGTAATKNASYTGAAAGAVSDLLAASATLAAGGVITITIPVTVNAGATGTKSNQASATGTGLSTAVLTDNAGVTADLPATVTAAPYNLTVPTGSVAQTIAATVDPTTLTITGFDFGDAPNDLTSIDAALTNIYPTTLAANGASHQIDGVTYLGAGVSTDSNGVPSVNADSDSQDDGVVFPLAGTQRVLLSGQSNSLSITASKAGILNAWIDWNQDGDWNDAGEQIALNVALSAGTNTLAITPNVNYPHGATYARFRFSSQSNLTPTGLASDGEVEDYKFYLALPSPSGCVTPMINAGFESSTHGAGTNSISSETTVPGWGTQSSAPNSGSGFDQRNSIEIWGTGFQGVPAFQGTYFAEINAYVSGTLYQDAVVSPGTIIRWQFAHRGRAGNDTVAVRFGTPDAQSTIGTFTSPNTEWRVYSGTYTVPTGQPITRFGFQATSTAAAGDNSVGNFIDDVRLTLACPPAVQGYKSVKLTNDLIGNGQSNPGDTLTYTIQYTNTGAGPATAFNLTDTLPPGVTITTAGAQTVTVTGSPTNANKNSSYTGVGSNTALLSSGASLDVGGIITVKIPVTIDAGFSGTVLNQSSATSNDFTGTTLSDNVDNATTGLPAGISTPTGSITQTQAPTTDPTSVTVIAPTVTAFKSVKLTTDADSSGTITAGDTLTWTVQYANTGTVNVPAFQIADQLPAGLTITAAGAHTVTVTGAGTSATKDATYTGATLATSMALTAGATLAVGGVISVSIPVTINSGFTGSLSNQASGSGTGLATAVSTDNAGATADLPATVTAAPYSLTIPASSVTQTIAASVDLTLAVVVAPPTVAAYKSVKLTTDADSSASVTSGDTLTYTIFYKNTGTIDVPGFQINDALPAGLTIIGAGNQNLIITGSTTATKNASYTGAAAGTVSDLLSASITFKAGDILRLDIPVTVNAGATGTLSNQAVGTATNLPVAGVRSDNVDSVTSGLSAGITIPPGSLTQTQNPTVDPTAVTIAVTPTVVAYKSVKLTTDVNSNSKADPGDTLTWSIWYENSGTVDVTTFQINDALPTGVTITAAGNEVVTVTGTTTATKSATYTGAAAGAVSDLLSATTTFKAGDLIQINIPVTVNAGFAGALSNQAKGSGSNLPPAGVFTDNADNSSTGLPSGVTIPTGSTVQTLTPATDPTTLTVAGIPLMTLVKSVTPTGDQQPGTDLTYKIVFTNTGNAGAQDIVIFDPIPNDTDFKLASATMAVGTTGLTMTAEYSNDFVAATPATATWTYTPVTAGGGADTGYDRNVKAVRWRVSAGTLSQTSPNHTGEVGFIVKIR